MAERSPLFPTVKTTVRLPKDLYRRLKHRAVEEGRTIADLFTDAVELYLSRSGAANDKSAPPSYFPAQKRPLGPW